MVRRGIEPGAVIILAGLALMATGLVAWLGWEIAAVAVGALLFVTGVASALTAGRPDGRGNP